jgi:uncharacterized protein (DUF58 family)
MNKFISKYIGALFLTNRFYWIIGICITIFVLSFFAPSTTGLPKIVLQVFGILVFIDYFFLFIASKSPRAKRITGERLSNGDDNKINLIVKSEFPFSTNVDIIDELPEQFQVRDWKRKVYLKAGEQQKFSYTLRPIERGEYNFGDIILLVTSQLGLVARKFSISAKIMVPVYPSFLQLRKYELLSRATIQTETGTKRLRKIGHSMEFEQIKEYVRGDDVRTLNWKATARKGGLMINTYADEKSQQVYCLVDKGRQMKMPFNGLTLLDYAINSSLVLSNVCLNKMDRVGLVTFSNKIDTILPADRKAMQMDSILQTLYKQKTDFKESDYEMLYMQIRGRIKQRSLLILFTNFESMSGLGRQMEYLKAISGHHLLLVVFFENTELDELTNSDARNIEQVYVKTIAEKFTYEKRLIVKELRKHGINSILTAPQNLTINIINKYLELKARQAI